MKVVIAPDKFKGSLSASQAAEAMTEGVRRACNGAEVVRLPIADGGEGTVEALVAATGGRTVHVTATGPLGEPVRAGYGWLPSGPRGESTAVLEMSSIAGFSLIPASRRDPMATTTYGVGQLMKAALVRGAERLVIGLGGSATNDAGMGMAQALGVRLLDSAGRDVGFGGGELGRVARISVDGCDPRLDTAEVVGATDVVSPLYGPEGAAFVFAPQKGATPEQVEELDQGLRRLARVIKRDVGVDVSEIPGAGAAGGLGAGIVAFAGGELKPGARLVLEAIGFKEGIKEADVVITGEGRLDAQTLSGKAPMMVARLSKDGGVPVVAVVGIYDHSLEDKFRENGLAAIYELAAEDREDSMLRAFELTVDAAERAMKGFMVRAGKPA